MFAELINTYRQNRKTLLFIVYVALFLDNMLLTTVGMLHSFFFYFLFLYYSVICIQSTILFFKTNVSVLILPLLNIFQHKTLMTFILVPIIPEYLLRLSHPNSTDLLLYNRLPAASNPREKREINSNDYNDNNNDDSNDLPWDNAWDIPMNMEEASNWEKSLTSSSNRKKLKTKKPPLRKNSRGMLYSIKIISLHI